MKLKDFSPRTQRSYLSAVKGIAGFHGKSPDQLSQEEIEDYILHLKDTGKSSNTRNVVISGLRFFYEHTLEDKAITLRMPRRRKPKILPEVLSKAQVGKIIAATGNIKHRLILMAAYSAGLRVGEIANLKINHIDSEQMVIRVEQGKGRKDRYTLLSSRFLGELRTYYKAWRPESYLFFAKNRHVPISITTMQKIYYRAKKDAGISKGRGIHTLRHCFASHLLDAGYDIRKIQLLMGHRSLSTTMVYLHVSQSRLAKVESPLDFMQMSENQSTPWEDDGETCH